MVPAILPFMPGGKGFAGLGHQSCGAGAWLARRDSVYDMDLQGL